LDYKI